MDTEENYLRWAVELQALAQAGLHYSRDVYDQERFQRIREIAAEMLTQPAGLPVEEVRRLFCCRSYILFTKDWQSVHSTLVGLVSWVPT